MAGGRDGLRFAVVGHAEWVDFVSVPHAPAAGEIVEALESWEEAAGGGAVAAVQLAKLAGGPVTFFTALGDDWRGRRAAEQLRSHGIELAVAIRNNPQRRGVALLDSEGERTIVVFRERLVPSGSDDLPFGRLAEMDGVYFTGGDVAVLRAARAAKTLVATPRARAALTESDVTLDVLVGSGKDQGELVDLDRLGRPPRVLVTTSGSRGGTYVASDGQSGSFEAPPLTGPVVDSYGAGDSFAAGLTFGLGAGMDLPAALALAARCGAGNLMARGPYQGQPTAADLGLP
jgi:ribokinase